MTQEYYNNDDVFEDRIDVDEDNEENEEDEEEEEEEEEEEDEEEEEELGVNVVETEVAADVTMNGDADDQDFDQNNESEVDAEGHEIGHDDKRNKARIELTEKSFDDDQSDTNSIHGHSSPGSKGTPYLGKIKPSADRIGASFYDIIPVTAAPHACPVFSMALSWGNKYLFTGGQDGYIRKYNFYDSISGKVQLTMAQKHPFVDSITRAGVLVSYWENEIPRKEGELTGKDNTYEPKLSPVYSLAVQKEALWLLSGLENGGITLQSIRHSEGQIQAYLKGHSSTVSVLKLEQDERKALSGSWDRSIVRWDLETGKQVRRFTGGGGQVTEIQWRPKSNGSIASAVESKDTNMTKNSGDSNNIDKGSDHDSEMGSLFGDEDEDDETDAITKSLEEELKEDEEKAKKAEKEQQDEQEGKDNEIDFVEVVEDSDEFENDPNVFLSCSITGVVDLWDIRQQDKLCSLSVPQGVPRWSTAACWSTDGNSIFVGRRNSLVEEFDVRSLSVVRTLKFPSDAGAVSTLHTMPGGGYMICGLQDNVRLYDLKSTKSTPFYIVPGHHGAVLSHLEVDPSCKYMITTSGGRGWQASSTDVAILYEITPAKE